MKFNQNQFLSCLSLALDFAEMDLLKDVTHHNQKVAYISDCIATYLEFDYEDRLDLATAALLHDSGIVAHSHDISEKGLQSEGLKAHCVHGEDILSVFPLKKPRKDILLCHHEYADGSGYFGLKEAPLLSQIISLANDVDILQVAGDGHEKILDYVESSGRFSTQLVNAFKQISLVPAFWLDMHPLFISDALGKRLPQDVQERSWDEVRKMTKVLSGIIDKKSIFTAGHSCGLAGKAEIMAKHYGFDDDRSIQLIIAADMHDLGKLAIPNAILDKPEKLTAAEFYTIQRHAYYTRRALEHIDGFERITEWASNHHEKTTGRGYPFGLSDLDFESRLMAVLDIYQALTEDRPYRSGLLHDEAMGIIQPLTMFGGLDPDIAKDVDEIFK